MVYFWVKRSTARWMLKMPLSSCILSPKVFWGPLGGKIPDGLEGTPCVDVPLSKGCPVEEAWAGTRGPPTHSHDSMN